MNAAAEQARVAAMLKEAEPILAKLRDRWWRMNHLYVVENRDGVKERFRCNWAQILLYRGLHYLSFCLKVRQIGCSTFMAIFMLDYCLFTMHKTCGIIDRTQEDATKKLAKARFAWDHLDDPDFPDTFLLGRWIKQKMGLRLVKDNVTELEWNNGSKIWAATSLRGSAVNILHVSELGWIAHNDPRRASEIAAGSFNTVSVGNLIVVETTHEGGRGGLCYELIRRAQANNGRKDLTPMDWKFFFFPWWREPTYVLEGPPEFETPAQARYFKQLEKACSVRLSQAQRNWWIKKSGQPRVDMNRQYPGTDEEALQAVPEGSVYGQEIANLRMAGRVKDMMPDGLAPFFTFWDLGMSDFTAIWLLQQVGRDFLAIDYYTAQGDPPGVYAGHMLTWEKQYHRPIARHFLPHDANNRGLSGKTYVDLLAEIGMRNVTVVPRTPDLWASIAYLRSLLPRFYFNAKPCEHERKNAAGRTLPSGLAALEGFHTKSEAVAGGAIKELPVHDMFSHGEAALRTFGDAHQRGMLDHYAAHSARTAHGGTTVRAVGVGEGRPDVQPDPRIHSLRGAALTVRSVRD